MSNAIDDPRDPKRHDLSGDKAVRAIVNRSLRWVAMQSEYVQAQRCEHGSYVGFERSLAYKCSMCNPEGDL